MSIVLVSGVYWGDDIGSEGWLGAVTGAHLFLPSWVQSETLYHKDDALLYIVYVMLIGAAPIPADRSHCSLWP